MPCGLCVEAGVAVVPQGGNTGLSVGPCAIRPARRSCCACAGATQPGPSSTPWTPAGVLNPAKVLPTS